MSKKPTPLEAYNRLCSHLDYDNSDYMHNGSYEEDSEIIETELKKLEEIDNRPFINGIREEIPADVICKKLKALDIIKENIGLKMSIDEDTACLYVPLDNKEICIVGYVIGKEKIDLLKGVLTLMILSLTKKQD